MAISTAPTAHGYALLIAADPPVRRPLPATAALPQLAAVPPARLVGAPYASAVQLANPDDPNTVLTHIRTAAAVDGPLLIYVAGHIQVDARQGRPHLALARTAPRTVRYTALPWHWLAAELQHRPPGSTTVLADLAAAPEVWQDLGAGKLSLGGPFLLYGTVQRSDKRHQPAPAYTHALSRVLRAGTGAVRPGVEELHAWAVREAGLNGAVTLWLGPTSAPAATPESAPAPAPAPAQAPAPAPAPAATPEFAPAPDPDPAPASAPASAPAPAPEFAPAPTSASAPEFAPAPAPTPAQPVRPPIPVVAAIPPVPGAAPAVDPHHAVFAAAAAGRHGEAAAMAAAWEQAALRSHGPVSPEAVHWIEVQAELARQADEPVRASGLWMRSAHVRLAGGQGETHPEVTAAVDRAHHCWHQVSNGEEVRRLGVELANLRSRVPGRSGARDDVQRRLAALAESVSR